MHVKWFSCENDLNSDFNANANANNSLFGGEKGCATMANLKREVSWAIAFIVHGKMIHMDMAWCLMFGGYTFNAQWWQVLPKTHHFGHNMKWENNSVWICKYFNCFIEMTSYCFGIMPF